MLTFLLKFIGSVLFRFALVLGGYRARFASISPRSSRWHSVALSSLQLLEISTISHQNDAKNLSYRVIFLNDDKTEALLN